MSIKFDSRKRLRAIEETAARRSEAALRAQSFRNGIARKIFALKGDVRKVANASTMTASAAEERDNRADALRSEINDLETELASADAVHESASRESQAARRLAIACRKFAEENALPLPLEFDDEAVIDHGLPVVKVGQFGTTTNGSAK